MDDNNVYRKLPNGRYKAIGYQYNNDWLSDGVWICRVKKGGKSIVNGEYYAPKYGLFKAGDNRPVDYTKLGGCSELTEYIANSLSHLDDDGKLGIYNISIHDAAVQIVKDVLEQSKDPDYFWKKKYNLDGQN
jgi:hypothetical protein